MFHEDLKSAIGTGFLAFLEHASDSKVETKNASPYILWETENYRENEFGEVVSGSFGGSAVPNEQMYSAAKKILKKKKRKEGKISIYVLVWVDEFLVGDETKSVLKMNIGKDEQQYSYDVAKELVITHKLIKTDSEGWGLGCGINLLQ